MAKKCPNCGAGVDVDFGMSQCPSCDSVFFVDLEGNISQESDSKQESAQEEVVEPQTVDSEFDNSWSENWQENPEDFASTENNADYGNQVQSDWGSISEDLEEGSEEIPEPWPQAESEELNSELDVTTEPDFVMEESEAMSSFEEAASYEPMSPKEHLKEIENYANSEDSSAREGLIFYDIELSGVDTNEELQLIRLILSDRKLMLSTEEILDKRENGSVVIPKLNPIKASIVVQQLRSSNIKMRWRQYAINE